MRNLVTKAAIALAVGSALVSALPAQARPRAHGGGYSHHGGGGYSGRGYSSHGYRGVERGHGGYRGYRGYHGGYYRDDTGLALGAGIIGLALGAAIASDGGRGYDRYETAPNGYYDGDDGTQGYDQDSEYDDYPDNEY